MEIVLRITFVYLVLTVAFRVLGKRELSQLSPFELIMLLLIAEIVSPSLTAGDESLTAAMFGVATLLCLAVLHSVLTYRFKTLRTMSEAPPSILVKHGKIMEANIHKDRVRPDEIFSEMHKAGIEKLSQVRWGFLEPDGKMSFVREDDAETQESGDKAPA